MQIKQIHSERNKEEGLTQEATSPLFFFIFWKITENPFEIRGKIHVSCDI